MTFGFIIIFFLYRQCTLDDLHAEWISPIFHPSLSTCLHCHLCCFFIDMYFAFLMLYCPFLLHLHNSLSSLYCIRYYPHRNTDLQCYKFKPLVFKITSQKYFYLILLIIESRHSKSWVHKYKILCACAFSSGSIIWFILIKETPKVTHLFQTIASISYFTLFHPFLAQDSCPLFIEMVKSSGMHFLI